jgi:hypothetical protein
MAYKSKGGNSMDADTYVVVACVLIAVVSVWRIRWRMRLELRRAKVEAFFYESLSDIWRAISTGGQASSCIDEGFAYIKSAPKEKSDMIRDKVYKILDKTYSHYLPMLREKVQRILEKEQSDERDETLYHLLAYNRDWLEIEEMRSDWYGTSWYGIGARLVSQLVQGWSKQPNDDRKFLLDEFEACESRIAAKKSEAEKVAKEKEAQERQDRQNRAGGDLGFWEHMQAVDRKFGVNSVRNFFGR